MAIKRSKWDIAFSNMIRERDNWTCQRCGIKYDKNTTSGRRALHCSHYMGRSKYSTRFSNDNCEALCHGCHRYFTAHPIAHHIHKMNKLGQDRHDELVLISNKSTSKKKLLTDEFLKSLNKMLKEYEEKNG